MTTLDTFAAINADLKSMYADHHAAQVAAYSVSAFFYVVERLRLSPTRTSRVGQLQLSYPFLNLGGSKIVLLDPYRFASKYLPAHD